ncbi:hypothetical protein LPJ73_007575 [Coemansia sp. RSA 2703]|nr:hypothetical protein LPJ73_007575 [Coemansia sp. RSA 2703]
MAATASISVPVVKSLTLATVSAMTATTVESATNTDIEETDAPAAAVAATATADPSLESVEPASASSSSGGVKLKPLMFANRANMSAFKPDDLDKFTFPSAQPSVNLAGIGKGGDAHANSASDAMRMENSGRMGFQGSMPADEGHKTGAKPGSAKPTGAKPHVAPTGAASGRADASKSGANKSQSGSAGDENSAMSQRSPIGLQLMAIVGAAAAVCGGALF